VSVPAVVPVRDANGQLVLLSPGLDDAQVRALFTGMRLRANRDGLFAENREGDGSKARAHEGGEPGPSMPSPSGPDPVSPGTRVADDCFCPECGARGYVLPCPRCSQP
jgi:hypothetical protein